MSEKGQCAAEYVVNEGQALGVLVYCVREKGHAGPHMPDESAAEEYGQAVPHWWTDRVAVVR